LILTSSFIQYSAGSVTQQNAPPKELDANVLFEKHCDTCHGKDGRAKTFKAKFNHARNLTASFRSNLLVVIVCGTGVKKYPSLRIEPPPV
jgi:hypothetical protein